MAFEKLFQAAEPAVAVRGVHLDLKGTVPTDQRLIQLLEVFAAMRYNAVLVEWEDSFPWTVDERFRSETAYSPDQVRRFCRAADEAGLEVIPLVQCLGHMETPLSVRGYEHLREVAHKSDVLNPLAAGARELVQRMVDDVLALMPGVKRFHLGGDEAWSLGTHADTKAYIARHGKGALYLHHVEPILDGLNARSIRPILWHDMMKDWEGPALARLRDKADLLVWGYSGHPDTTAHHYSSRVIERFKEHGLRLWGGTAYKGADGHNVDLPNFANRQANALAWAEVARRYGMMGVFATAWSRYSTQRVQNEPIDAALDSLLNVAAILHDGKAVAGGAAACAEALAEIGQKDRFLACRTAMDKLGAARRKGWQAVQGLREQLAVSSGDARRRGSGGEAAFCRTLCQAVRDADGAAAEARSAFVGLMDPLWTDRYLAERIEPLREELGTLEARVRQVDPAGWQAVKPPQAP